MATKKKVFVSFDFVNDKIIKEFLIGQSKLEDSPFEVIDGSLKEAAPKKEWEDKAKAKIRASDIVIVMVGPKSYKASGILKEVEMANDLGKKIIQIIGYKNGNYSRVEGAGILYKWNWESLKRLFA